MQRNEDIELFTKPSGKGALFFQAVRINADTKGDDIAQKRLRQPLAGEGLKRSVEPDNLDDAV